MSSQKLLSVLHEAGYFSVQEILFNTQKFVRFKLDEKDHKKSGAYKCYENQRENGEVFYVLIYGNHREKTMHQYCTLDTIDPEAKKIIKKAKKEADNFRKEIHEETAKYCENFWNDLAEETPLGDYMVKKGFNKSYGSKSLNGITIIPMRDIRGKIWCLQKIFADGNKRFETGGRTEGLYYLLGDDRQDGPIRICEGFATAATVYEATNETTACAFSAGNLREVTVALKQQFPNRSIIVCGDDDKFAEDPSRGNIGRIKAYEAINGDLGIPIFPRFKDENSKPTDWDDLRQAEGIEEVRKQLTNLPEKKLDIYQIIKAPYPDVTDKGRLKGSLRNVKELLDRLKIVVRYNVISKEEEIIIPNVGFTIDNRANATIAHLIDWCARVELPHQNLINYITAIADQNLYNPVATWIESKPWDGISRLQEFFDTIVSPNREFKEKLIRTWLVSAIAAAFEPNGVSAHGVLVLQGKQNIGKTKWFKNLAPPNLNVLADGALLRPEDKDSVSQIISKWIVELGELDATFRKADIAQLKAFITRDRDTLRMPYAPKKSNFARRTIFFGSVNETDFLKDPTGNRRFWTIPCESINYDHGIDMQQLWAEVLLLYRAGEKWTLSSEDVETLSEANKEFEAKDVIAEMISERFKWDWDASRDLDISLVWITASMACELIGIKSASPSIAKSAGKALREMTKSKTIKGYARFAVPLTKGQQVFCTTLSK